MARKPRTHYYSATYHVMLRGNNRQRIFEEPKDYQHFLLILQEAIEKFTFVTHSYCLMPNHLHMIIEVRNKSLSKIMHNIGSRYVKHFNRKYGKVGHLFQGRFKALLVHDEQHLLELCRYIDLNPVVAKMVQTPEDYHWSSHRTFLGLDYDGITATVLVNEVLKKWSHGKMSYSEFVNRSSNDTELPNETNWDIDDYFVEGLATNFSKKRPYAFTIDDIIIAVCEIYNISEAGLTGPGKSRRSAMARGMIIYLNQEFGISSSCELSRKLQRHVATISNMATRYTAKVATDIEFKRQLDDVLRTLDCKNISNA